MGSRLLNLSWSIDRRRTIVHLHGQVDADAVLDLRALGVVADHLPTLVVDLRDVTVEADGVDILLDLTARPNVEVQHPPRGWGSGDEV